MFKGMLKTLAIFTLLLLSTVSSQANDGLVGFEWTFTNLELVNASKPQTYVPDMPPIPGRGVHSRLLDTTIPALQESPWNQVTNAWLAEIRKQCPDCRIDKKTVHLPDGFWFKITSDGPVLEVLTEPMTYKQLKERKDILEKLIWKAAKKAGVTPDKRLGGGHVHLDIASHFGGDRVLFRNFVVDLMNRPELFMGGLGINYFNAPPLSFYGAEAIERFKELVMAFDKDKSISMEDFMNQMNDFYVSLEHPVLPTPYAKFQAVNFMHLIEGTLELRAVRPQISAESAKRLVKLIQSRIKALKKHNTLIEMKIPDLSKSFKSVREKGYRHYSHSLGPKAIMTAVRDYAEDAGLERTYYDDFVTEELKDDLKKETEIKKASKSVFAGSCGSFL